MTLTLIYPKHGFGWTQGAEICDMLKNLPQFDGGPATDSLSVPVFRQLSESMVI